MSFFGALGLAILIVALIIVSAFSPDTPPHNQVPSTPSPAWLPSFDEVFGCVIIFGPLVLLSWHGFRFYRRLRLRKQAKERQRQLLDLVNQYGTEIQRERVKKGFGDLEKDAAVALEPMAFAPLREAGFKSLDSNGEFMDAKDVGDVEFELIAAVEKLMPDARVKPVKSLNGHGPAVSVEVYREGVRVSKSFCR